MAICDRCYEVKSSLWKLDLSITEIPFVPILNISFRHFCIICSPLLHFCDGTLCFISWYIYMDWSSNRRHLGNVSLSLRLILFLKYLMTCVCYFSLKRCLLVVCAFQCIEQRMCFICKVIICSLSFTEIMTYLSYLTYIYIIYIYVYICIQYLVHYMTKPSYTIDPLHVPR